MADNLHPVTVTPRQALLAAIAVLGRCELDVPLGYACALYSPPQDATTRHRFLVHTPSGEDLTLTWRLCAGLPPLAQIQGNNSLILRPTTHGTDRSALGLQELPPDALVGALRITQVTRAPGLRDVQSFAEALGSAYSSLVLPEDLHTPLIVTWDYRPAGWPP